MTVSARRIESPPTGQVLEFLITSEESGGELLRVRVTVAPGGRVPNHVHPEQEERFEVVSGRPTFRARRRSWQAEPGEHVTLAPGEPHLFRNDTDQDIQMIAEVRPALRSEEVFDALFRLAREGRTRGRIGAPGPFATSRLIRDYEREFFYLSAIPLPLQKALKVLAR